MKFLAVLLLVACAHSAANADLVADLGNPDPNKRDKVAYETLDRQISKELSDADVRALVTKLLPNLAAGPAGDAVFRRSFSALVLASIVRRDVAKPFLTDAERRTILTTARDYAHREIDLRGYTGAHGWAHAAAHTADLLAQLAKEPALGDDDRAIILDAVAGFVARKHGTILCYGEDGRLAVPVILAVRKGIPEDKLTAFLAAIKAPLVEQNGEPFDVALYAAQRNARNLLFTLFVQASMVKEPTDGERRLLDAVRAILAE